MELPQINSHQPKIPMRCIRRTGSGASGHLNQPVYTVVTHSPMIMNRINAIAFCHARKTVVTSLKTSNKALLNATLYPEVNALTRRGNNST